MTSLTLPPFQRQTTLARRVTLVGTGAHTGRPCRMFLMPSDASSGVVFSRLDAEEPVVANWRKVRDTRLRVELGAGDVRVSTVEHVTAALSGLGVDNALIEVDGPEVPALDGSARQIAEAILEAGVQPLAAPRRMLRILQTIRVENGAAWAELAPIAAPRLEIDVEIDFPRRSAGSASGAPSLRASLSGNSPGRAASASWKTRKSFGARDLRSAPPSKTPSSSRRAGPQPGGAAPRRRAGAPQGARRAGRSCAGRRADPRPIPLLSRRPCAQCRARRAAHDDARRLQDGGGSPASPRGPGRGSPPLAIISPEEAGL